MSSYASAMQILPLVFKVVPSTDSLVDLGAGEGAWLRAARVLGVPVVKGYDLNGDMDVVKADLSKELTFERRYDLAVSVEVVEHLHRTAEKAFLDNVVNASDFILFSGAVPGQFCEGHINCNWLSYWVLRFAERGYKLADCLRQQVWNNVAVDPWYAQNIVLFAKNGVYGGLKLPEYDYRAPLDIIHPALYYTQDFFQNVTYNYRKWAAAVTPPHQDFFDDPETDECFAAFGKSQDPFKDDKEFLMLMREDYNENVR